MELYDALIPVEARLINALSSESLRVIDPLKTEWITLTMELALYNLAIEKGDTTAANEHLAKIEIILNSSDLEVTYQSYLLREFRLEKFESVSTNQTWSAEEGSLLTGIDISHESGTPTVRVGTTDGGDEILGDRLITALQNSNNTVRKSFIADDIIYITISGGTVDVNLDYETNYQ